MFTSIKTAEKPVKLPNYLESLGGNYYHTGYIFFPGNNSFVGNNYLCFNKIPKRNPSY